MTVITVVIVVVRHILETLGFRWHELQEGAESLFSSVLGPAAMGALAHDQQVLTPRKCVSCWSVA